MATLDESGGNLRDSESALAGKNPVLTIKFQFYFLNLIGVLLFIAAATNLCAADQSAAPLDWPNSLFQLNGHWALSNRWVLVISAVMELLISGLILAGKSAKFKFWLLAWFATVSATYRIGLRIIGAPNLGDCLGNYVDWFFISPRIVAIVCNVCLSFVLMISCTILLLNWLSDRKASNRSHAVREGEKPGVHPQPIT